MEIDIGSLCENDIAVIHEHCGVISGTLIRASTESLIKLKYVTDNRDVENYVAACTVSIRILDVCSAVDSVEFKILVMLQVMILVRPLFACLLLKG